MKKPIIGVTCAYVLGIACASQIPMPLVISSLLLPLLIFLLLTGLILWLCFKAKGLTGLILLAFFLLGILLYQLHSHPPSSAHLANLPKEFLGRAILVEGTICAPPERICFAAAEEGKLRLVLDQVTLQGEKATLAAQGRVRILLKSQAGDLQYGERIRLAAELRQPRGYLNPGGFCLRRYLLSQRIYLEGRARSKEGLLRLGWLRGPTFLGLLYELRSKMLDRMQAQIDAPYYPILQAITLGERSSLDKKTEDDFVGSGTFHILAISGLNVSMVAAFLYLLLRLLRLPLRFRAALTILWVALYAFLAGGSSSVVRAAIMTSLFLGALLLEREVDLWNTLALSALLILLWNPLHLLEAGFQLTFAATLGILVLTKTLSGSSLPRVPRWLLASLLVSLAASLATLPVLAHHFHRASFIGILANLPIVPLSGIITALGLVFAGFSLFHLPGLHGLAQLLQFLIALMTHLAHFFSSWPGASIPFFGPSVLMILFYYGFWISACAWRKARWAKVSLALCVVALASLVGARLYQVHHRTDLRVSFLDVGQGDCALLELPGGRAILIDGGGSRQGEFDVGEQVVRPYLLHRWVGKLNRIILSHPHPDHLRGLLTIVKDFRVEEAWEGRGSSSSPLYQEFRSLLEQKGIPLRHWVAGERPKGLPPLGVKILHPSPPYLQASPRGAYSDENNNSLVLKIHYGGVSLLFAGDIGAEAETRILRRGIDLKSDVIKVPHHGGRTSSTARFIWAVRPTYAIASAGAFNPFGHPSPEVVKRYRAMGARFLQTGRDGAIILVTDGKGLKVWKAEEERGRRHNLWMSLLGWD